MPEPRDRLARLLVAALPRRTARELFEPAWHDLWSQRLRGLEGTRRAPARSAVVVVHTLRALLLFVDCWRLTVAEVLSARSTPRRRGHDRPRKEISKMALELVRQAFRRLVREPAFTLTALPALALGVGANVAIFAVVDAAPLRPLPLAGADRLVVIEHRNERTGVRKEFIPVGDYIDLAARQTTCERIAAYGGGQTTVAGEGQAQPYRLRLLSAGPGLLDLLRVRPLAGRGLSAADSRPGAEPVMLLSEGLWRSRYGGAPRILGRMLPLEEAPRRVVGIVPDGFGFGASARAEAVVPMTLPPVAPPERTVDWVRALARLRPGVSEERADANLGAVSRALSREFPESNEATTYGTVPLRRALLGDTRPALLLLSGAAGVVLLITCVNVANLLLARGVTRRREMELRLALGAGRGRLVAQLLAEGLALSLVAGVAGVALAGWGGRALVALLPHTPAIPALAALQVRGPALWFALGVVVLTTLAFALAAAAPSRAARASVAAAVAKASAGAGARRAMSTFVVVEVALAVVLLFGAGLILRSFAGLLSADPGFRTEQVMTLDVQLPGDRYGEVSERGAFYRRALAALHDTPGVEAAGVAVVVPLTGNNWTAPFERADRPLPAGERPPEVGWQQASAGYFAALHIPLLSGRLFDDRERPGSARSVIVSAAVAKRFFPDGPAVGRSVVMGGDRFEIVGVVGDIRRTGLADEPHADMYFPWEGEPSREGTFFLRTSGDPIAALPALRATLMAAEPRLLVLGERSMAEVVRDSVQVTRVVLVLLGLFAATALVLAALGIFGVMSYAVRLRSREIGTRVAIGATAGQIQWMVLREGGVIAGVGAIVGLAAALASTRVLTSVLFGVSPTDAPTMLASLALLGAAVAFACWLPARRAATADAARTLAEP